LPTLRTETAIIGGGLMGSWTAFFLRRRGHAVTVLEKGVVGAQASGVNFGNVRLQAHSIEEIPLALRAHALWEEHERLVGESCEYAATGHLRIAASDADMAVLERDAAEQRPYGLELEMLDGVAVRRRWPWLSRRIVGACWSRRDGTANPRLAGPAVARAARGLGAEIIERTKVIGVERVGHGFRLATDCDLVVESETLVNAAGAWAVEIAARFGETAPLFAAGPAQFVTEPLPYFIEPSVQAVDGSTIFRQVTRGNVIVTGFPRGPSDAIRNRAPVDPHKTLAHMSSVVAVVPKLAGCVVIRCWSGIEGYLPDMLPVIGPSRTTSGLFHAFGFSGHGFQLAPGVGLVMSELVLDGASPTPLGPFAISRFEGAVTESDKLRREFDPAAAGTRLPI
jgi:sarcosine oxidase subunit beta